MNATRIEISLKTIFTILLIILSVFVLTRIIDIVVLLMIAFVLMTALHPLVTAIQRALRSRVLSVLLVYTMLISSLVIATAVIIPPLVAQTKHLLSLLPFKNVPYLKELTQLTLSAEQFATLITQYGNSIGSLFSIVTSTFSVFFSIFTVLVMTLYLLLEREHLYRYTSLLFRTPDRNDRGRKLLNSIDIGLGSWVRGEFLLMITIGIMTYIGLTILGVPYAVPLAILAGIMEALPNLGPTLSAIPAVIIAGILVNPIMGVVTVILYMLIQAIENNLIVPQVMRNAVGISPLLAIVLILTGVRFGGAIGALLIIPAFIIVRVLLQEFSPEIRNIVNGK